MEITLIVAIVTGLTEVIKRIGLPSKFAPIMSISFGLALAFLNRQGLPIDVVITTGIIAGLSASGLYSGVKKTVSNK